MNIQDSILAPYVSDPKDDGSYVLNLSHEDTMRLWEAVDAQTAELERLRAAVVHEVNPDWVTVENPTMGYAKLKDGKWEFGEMPVPLPAHTGSN